jgi:hypothetical protein
MKFLIYGKFLVEAKTHEEADAVARKIVGDTLEIDEIWQYQE